MGRVTFGICLLLLLSSSAVAAPAVDPFNVDISIGWDGCYRTDRWTPVAIGIGTILKGPVGGAVLLEGRQDELHRLGVAHPFVVTNEAPARFSLATRLCPASDRFNLSLIDEKGRTIWKNDYEMWNLTRGGSGSAVDASQLFIGLCGKRGFSLPKLSEHILAQREGGGANKIQLKEKLPSALPWDWTGYDCLDALILYDLDWAALRTQQAQAICDWVSRGGRLMLILGSHPMPDDSPLRNLLPVRIGALKSHEAPFPWLIKPLDSAKGTLNVRALEIVDARCCQPVSTNGAGEAEEVLAATGQFGFGKVLMLGFDPAELEGVSAENAAGQWFEWLSVVSQPFHLLAYSRNEERTHYSNGSSRGQMAGIQQYLQDIPQLRPLSVGWILLLLLGLAVLLGPVDYLVLKKLDRLPLTWITSLVIIGLFTAGAYFGARALRSGDLQLRFVSGVDAIQDGPAWQNTYYGIYAPSSSSYELSGVGKGQWWSPFTAGDEGYRYYPSGLATRTILCQQRDGMNVPLPLPISIWSMQCMQEECPAAGVPIRVAWQGKTVTITNTSASVLSQVRVYTKETNVAAGSIAPGQSRKLDLPRNSSRSRFSEAGGGELGAAAGSRRSLALDQYLDAGACVVTAAVDDPVPPHTIANRSARTAGTQTIRLVVLPSKEVNHD